MFAGDATSPEDRRLALTALINAKILPRLADDPAISRGRLHVLAQVHATDPVHRMLGLAESIRLGQVVKRWAVEIKSHLAPVFATELPPMRLLADADDRLNLARACSQGQAEWLPGYLARSVAEEEAGEKARAELVSALLARSTNLAEAFRLLVGGFEKLRPTTEAPGETVARRLTRTLAALRSALQDSDLEAGEGLGKAFHALISAPLGAVGKPQEKPVQVDLSAEAMLMLHEIVRTRMSVAADPEMYGVVEYCRRLCGGSTWPDDLQKPIARLIADVTEALILLGRQGQCDQGLLDQLQVLCSYPERARVVAKEIAAKHPELPEEVRDWLSLGRRRVVRSASGAAIEAAASSADESIGLALQAVRQARSLRDSLIEPLISSLDISDPNLVQVTKEMLGQVQQIAVLIEQAAGLRSLALYGRPGEEIEMSAKFFNVVGDAPRQRMIVRQPAVVRNRADGSVGDVVTKGLVE